MTDSAQKRVVIRNGFVVTGASDETYLDPGTIVVEGPTIESVQPTDRQARFPEADEVIDASGKAVMPGMINAHTHLETTALTGAFSEMNAGGLALQMGGLLGRLLEPEFRYLAEAGWRLAALLHIKGGITALNSMDIRPSVGADILGDAGLRATLGSLISDFFLDEPLDSQMARARAFIDEHHDTRDGRIRASICPHGDLWTTDAAWEEASRLAEEYPDLLVHTHLDELPESRKHARYEGLEDPLAIPERHGLVDEQFCAAHFRKASDAEARRLAGAGAGVAHCPTIISYWSSGDGGWMPMGTLREHGASIGLGLDDSYWHDSHDMFREAKTARLFANHYEATPAVDSSDLLRMLTAEGAETIGIDDHTGRIAEGYQADLTVVDLEEAWMQPHTNLPARLVNTASNRDVESVMVDGEFLMRDRHVRTLDESAVIEQAREAVERFEAETEWELSRTGADGSTFEALEHSPFGGMIRVMCRLGWQSLKEAVAGS
jgi:5-methylthioadenosine/S-adenosylhomocysteine deaminase